MVVNGAFLFSTYNRDSERALAQLAVTSCSDRTRDISVLIAGLGAGFCLQAALEYELVKRATVVEKESVIVDWARTLFSPHNSNALDDPRVSIIIQDFVEFIQTSRDLYDAVCVDVDNGPQWTVWDRNRILYETQGLEQIRRLIVPGGCLTIWSSRKSKTLEEALVDVFGDFSTHTVRATEMGRENDYLIYRASFQGSC